MLRLVLLALMALAHAAQAAPLDRQELRIGLETSEPPFAFVDDTGEFRGFNADIASALCMRMQVRCSFVPVNIPEFVQQLQSRAVDLVPSLSITEARRQDVDFTDPYYLAPSRFVAKRGRPLDPAATGLRGLVVGVQRGTVQDRYVTSTYPAAIVRRYADKTELYLDLALGRLDTALANVVASRVQFLGTDLGAEFEFVGPVLDDKSWFGEGVGIGVRKGDGALLKALNQALREIRSDGTFDAIRSQYFSFELDGT